MFRVLSSDREVVLHQKQESLFGIVDESMLEPLDVFTMHVKSSSKGGSSWPHVCKKPPTFLFPSLSLSLSLLAFCMSCMLMNVPCQLP